MLTATQLVGGSNPLDNNQPYDLEGNCGLFARNIEWTVNQAPRREGIIFQLVKRTINASRWDVTSNAWVQMGPGDVDTYVGVNHSPKLAMYSLYWEAWTIEPGNTHPVYRAGRLGRADDCFGLTAVIPAANHATSAFQNTTRGTFTIAGAAFFMETDLDVYTDFGFSINPQSPASAIPSHIALGRRMFEGMVATSDFIKHVVTVSWNSSVQDADGTYGVTSVDVDTVATVNRLTVGRSLTALVT